MARILPRTVIVLAWPNRAASRKRCCRGPLSTIETHQPLGLAPRALNEVIKDATIVHDELPDTDEVLQVTGLTGQG